jgi:hypothetical protein
MPIQQLHMDRHHNRAAHGARRGPGPHKIVHEMRDWNFAAFAGNEVSTSGELAFVLGEAFSET